MEAQFQICDICNNVTDNVQAHKLAFHSKNVNIRCGLCSKVFSGMVAFQAHMPEHTKSGKETAKFHCNFKACTDRFFKKEHLLLHLKLEHDVTDKSSIFECGFCEEVYLSITRFRDHLKKAHNHKYVEEKPKPELLCSINGHMKCNFCPEKFSIKENLVKHILLHLESLQISNVPHACSSCPYKTRRYNRLYTHYQKIHFIEWPRFKYECQLCPKTFKLESELDHHIAFHAGHRYICDICGKQSNAKKTLVYHFKRVHGPKNYICETCGAKFSTKEMLNRHQKSHTAPNGQKCPRCHFTTHCELNLKQHMKIHKRRKRTICKICNSSVLRINEHMAIHNGTQKKYKCEICKHISVQKNRHIQHMNKHLGKKVNNCNICGEEYVKTESLKNHRLKCHGIMPYLCDLCDVKGFMTLKNLKAHKAKAHRNKID